MQFVEWSVLGLRSARYVFAHPERKKFVTLFPMVHVGERQFYDAVHEEAAQHDAVILEGMRSKIGRRLTRSYRWIKPENLGLVVQPRFARSDVPVFHGDLSAEAFEAIWNKASLRERLMIEHGAAPYGLWQRLSANRTRLGQYLSQSDLTDRDSILSWTEENAPLREALWTARDEVLKTTLCQLVETPKHPGSVAVIYGASHMGPLAQMLSALGFKILDSSWQMVFEA